MCGTLCNENTADLMVQAGLVESLFQLMSDKKEDDEMVLQISYTFYQLLVQEPTREALLRYTQVVFYLVDLLQDKNREVPNPNPSPNPNPTKRLPAAEVW